MERSVTIRKNKSALYTAAAQAAAFTLLAFLFGIVPGGHTALAFIFLALSLFGWGMILDWFTSHLTVDDHGIKAAGFPGRQKQISWEEIESIGVRKNFLFVYGRKNRVLTSLDASLADYPQALQIMKDHGAAVHDQNYRKRTDSSDKK